jgi:hypothetical protein
MVMVVMLLLIMTTAMMKILMAIAHEVLTE